MGYCRPIAASSEPREPRELVSCRSECTVASAKRTLPSLHHYEGPAWGWQTWSAWGNQPLVWLNRPGKRCHRVVRDWASKPFSRASCSHHRLHHLHRHRHQRRRGAGWSRCSALEGQNRRSWRRACLSQRLLVLGSAARAWGSSSSSRASWLRHRRRRRRLG